MSITLFLTLLDPLPSRVTYFMDGPNILYGRSNFTKMDYQTTSPISLQEPTWSIMKLVCSPPLLRCSASVLNYPKSWEVGGRPERSDTSEYSLLRQNTDTF